MFYITHIAAYMNVSTAVIYRLIKKFDLSKYVNTIKYKGIKRGGKKSRAGGFLNQYKEEVLEYIRKNPTKTRYQISKVLEKEYFYILKYDKEWVNEMVLRSKNKTVIDTKSRLNQYKKQYNA